MALGRWAFFPQKMSGASRFPKIALGDGHLSPKDEWLLRCFLRWPWDDGPKDEWPLRGFLRWPWEDGQFSPRNEWPLQGFLRWPEEDGHLIPKDEWPLHGPFSPEMSAPPRFPKMALSRWAQKMSGPSEVS